MIKLPRIKYTSSDITLLARIMRAEALGEGSTGMLLVGNVVVNRAKAQCPPFKKTNTIYSVVYKKGQFEGVGTPLFNKSPTKKEKDLAKACLDYYRKWPATNSLYFKNPGKNVSCPKNFFGPLIGRYKQHCFYGIDNVSKCHL